MSYEKEIVKKFLEDKPKDYEIQEGEQQLINLMVDVINGLMDEKKYINGNYKRVLDEKLNLEEIVDEQRDTIKELKKEIERLM
jgi:hypothetical protein